MFAPMDEAITSASSIMSANTAHFTLKVEGLVNTGLQVLGFDGIEAINKPYTFEIKLVNKHVRYDITQLLSKSAYFSYGSGCVHGVIQQVSRDEVDHHYAYYTVILTPQFTHLQKTTNQRIFQNKTVPDIISQLLTEHGILDGVGHEFRLDKSTYQPRDYCVQYDETDAYFIQRLCEEEGIHYHFEHKVDSHLMVFGDIQPNFTSLGAPLLYASDTGFVAGNSVIKRFNVSLASRTKSATWKDYNFVNTKIPTATIKGTQSKKANEAEEPEHEHYDYPGRVLDNKQAERLAKIEIERLRTDHVTGDGASDINALHCGYYFEVMGHPSIDTQEHWLLNEVRHQGKQPQVLEAFGDSGFNPNLDFGGLINACTKLIFSSKTLSQGYRNTFTATPMEVIWRPAKVHPKSKILGSQTARVTGAEGEEIFCDEFGRVKVRFHWDREQNIDALSSCWIRVASGWAHNGYGAVTIPRVGMEVLVTFLESDPDQPLITGCIHNGVNQVPYDLPANKTRTVFKTNSSKGGGGFNELRIEDKAGSEQIYVRAQKDKDTAINNNETLSVGRDRAKTVAKNEIVDIGKNQKIDIGESLSLTVAESMFKMDALGITLQIGASRIVMTAAAIHISSIDIHLDAENTINQDAPGCIFLNSDTTVPAPILPVSADFIKVKGRKPGAD